MGGPGSSRWFGYQRRTTVEECLELSIVAVAKHLGGINNFIGETIPLRQRGVVTEFSIDGSIVGVGEDPKMIIDGQVDGDWDPVAIYQEIDLVCEETNTGAYSWGLFCPGYKEKFSKLYLPPGENRFLSRPSWGLGYESSLKSG